MRHQIKGKKLGRTRPHRKAMLANMATSLFDNYSIQTTEAKAKELKKLADRLISTAKADTLEAKRRVGETIRNKAVMKKLFHEIIPQFADRESGFTRVLRVGVRRGDSARMSVVQLLAEKPVKEESKKGKSKKDKEKK